MTGPIPWHDPRVDGPVAQCLIKHGGMAMGFDEKMVYPGVARRLWEDYTERTAGRWRDLQKGQPYLVGAVRENEVLAMAVLKFVGYTRTRPLVYEECKKRFDFTDECEVLANEYDDEAGLNDHVQQLNNNKQRSP